MAFTSETEGLAPGSALMDGVMQMDSASLVYLCEDICIGFCACGEEQEHYFQIPRCGAVCIILDGTGLGYTYSDSFVHDVLA